MPGETIEASLRLPDVGEHERAEARTSAVADPLAVGERVVENPAADAVAGLERHHLFARGHELTRGDQTRDPGADDGHVGLDAFRHGGKRT